MNEKTSNNRTAAVPADIAQLSFEEAMSELEKLVRQLEEGKAKLDDAIGAYERGAMLKRHCESKLREAQVKIERIALGPDGKPAVSPFNT
ncbi:MAG: exodeoxyribonuclease VII small subunit [Bdellovibrionales bacterium]